MTVPSSDVGHAVPVPLVEPADLSRGDCQIRHVVPSDYEWIFERLWLEPQSLLTHRFLGVPPAPEQLPQLLWAGVAGQFLIVRAGRPQERYGMVSLYNYNQHAQHCGISMAFAPEARGLNWPMIGAGLVIQHWFRVTRTNKLWAEIPEWNMPLLRGIKLFGFEQEGCQHQHEWLDGRSWNRYLFALFRHKWDELQPLNSIGRRERASHSD